MRGRFLSRESGFRTGAVGKRALVRKQPVGVQLAAVLKFLNIHTPQLCLTFCEKRRLFLALARL